jgi:hypothetical protein
MLNEQSNGLSSVSTPAQGSVAQYADPNYTGNRRGGGFGGLEDPHTMMTILAIGTAFIPVVGPFISAGIGLADAAMYYNEGDKKTAGIVGALSILPFIGTVIVKIPGVKELGVKGMASLASKLSKGGKNLTKIESEVLNSIKNNESLIKQELTNAGTKLTPLTKQIQTLKPSYIERFGQAEYDKLLGDFISGTKDKNLFIKTLSSTKANPKIANFISKFGIKFTQNELKQIHEYTSIIKNLPKVLTKFTLESMNPTVNVITKNGPKTIKLKFITANQAVKTWGEKYRTVFGFAGGNKVVFIVDNIKKMSSGDLDQLFYHEFAHIKDPSNISSKLTNVYKPANERYSKEYFSKGYYFHPRELVANTSKILNGMSVNLKNNIKSLGKDRSLKTLDDLISWAKGTKKDFTEDMIKVLGYDQKFVKEHLDILMEKNSKEYRNLVTKIAQQSDYLKSQVKLAL